MKITVRPTSTDIARLLRQHNALRALRDARTGDLYVWEAEAGAHNDAIRQLGGDMLESVGFIFTLEDFKKLT